VTDEQSMTAAVAEIEQEHGAVDVLVNNAGYGQYGAIEQLAIEDLRAQFETNVFGAVRLAQLVLPAMRARHRGRILNISSMGGRTTLPGGGAYHASKYALEAISDALRMEVRSFGIYVVLIEPGIALGRRGATRLHRQWG
jgi:NAD(P)-dependent dehydrogenase (short-subunit alcohol dehydrogenase family)